MNIRKLKAYLLGVVWIGAFYSQFSIAQNAADLIEIDLEDLMNMDVEVESAGKNKTKAADLPYAAHVITKEDIAASGVTHVADALGLAPGVAVDRITASQWSVAIRGAGGQFSRFVLVLVDGRIVFNTVFSGVNWDELNVSLPNIERIEIIRGPNAAAWGANAVNGIINIITKTNSDAKQSQVEAYSANNGQQHAYAQFAGSSHDWEYAVSAHFQQQDAYSYDNDEIKRKDSNGRLYTSLQSQTSDREIFLNAEIFQIKNDNPIALVNSSMPTMSVAESKNQKNGFAMQYLYKRDLNEKWAWQGRLSIEDLDRKNTLYHWDSTQYQIDLDTSGQYTNHAVSAGINTRISKNRIITEDEFPASLNPEQRTSAVYGIYLSDVWDLTKKLQITLSARTDYNELSKNLQFQPSIRGLWQQNEHERYWVAISRASGTTPRAFTDVAQIYLNYDAEPNATQPLPILIEINEVTEDFEDINLTSTEIGYRKIFENATIDFTAFHFSYKNDINTAPNAPPSLVLGSNGNPIYLLQTVAFTSDSEFNSDGFEVSSRVNVTHWWSLQGYYAYLDTDATAISWRHTASVMNTFIINRSLKFNWLSTIKRDEIGGQVDGYLQTNLNFQWHASKAWDFTFSANNLGPTHKEAAPELVASIPSNIEPYVLVKAKFSF